VLKYILMMYCCCCCCCMLLLMTTTTTTTTTTMMMMKMINTVISVAYLSTCTVLNLYWRLWTQATASMFTSLWKNISHLNDFILTILINSCQQWLSHGGTGGTRPPIRPKDRLWDSSWSDEKLERLGGVPLIVSVIQCEKILGTGCSTDPTSKWEWSKLFSVYTVSCRTLKWVRQNTSDAHQNTPFQG